jgi:dTDP-4-dehydrorhamnose reductase
VKALVAGAGGQLGRDLVTALGVEVAWAGGRSELDVTDAEAVVVTVRRVAPDVIFNAAAYNKVDGAESETARALEVNALGPRLLAQAATEAGALLVHFSTDYVFDGTSTRPYREEDCPHPLGAYGVSKLAGEGFVAGSRCKSLIVRSSGVFGRGGNRQKGGSFVERVLEQARAGRPLRVVKDQVFSPTYAPDLARALKGLVEIGARGLFHVTNSGECSWHRLAVKTLEVVGLSAPVEEIRSAELAAPARRPSYSVLAPDRYLSLGLPPLRPWDEALAESLSA